jgi:Disulfide bond formation protein DsbB
MTHDTIVVLAILGVAEQGLAGLGLLAGGLAVAGIRRPSAAIRSVLWGYELWAAFVVAAIATGGSLFFSEIAHFVPCELCWYQRICMYPLSIVTLLAAIAGDFRVARYLLPLPLVGAGVSVYHLLVENGVVGQSAACLVQAGQRGRVPPPPRRTRRTTTQKLLYDNQGTENTGWLDNNMVTAAASSIPGLRVHELLSARELGKGQGGRAERRQPRRGRQRHEHADHPRRQVRHPRNHGHAHEPNRRADARQRRQRRSAVSLRLPVR